MFFGTVFATIVGVLLDLPPVLQIPVVLLVGMLAGAAAGALVGWLKAKFGIHEVITSIMLNWISLYFNNFVVNSEHSIRPIPPNHFPLTHRLHDALYGHEIEPRRSCGS